MAEENIKNKETNFLSNKFTSYLRESYFNEKNKANKGSSMLKFNEDNEKDKKNYEKLCDELKDSQILLSHEIKFNFPQVNFEKIIVGGKKYNDIYEIGKNEIGKKEIDNFRDFLQEIKEKIVNNYKKNIKFKLKLDIKGDREKNNLVLKCIYNLKPDGGEKTTYKDFDILVNKTSEGFNFLLEYLNSLSDAE